MGISVNMDPLVCQCVKEYDASITLRPKQVESLNFLARENRDLIVNLPVGYGKTLVYHIIPNFLGRRHIRL